MEETQFPDDEEIAEFMSRLRMFTESLPEPEQQLMNAMVCAAMGGNTDEIHAYWSSGTPTSPPTLTTTPWHAAFFSHAA